MPRTRSTNPEPKEGTVKHIPSDDDVSELDEMPATRPSASFRAQLTKFEFTQTANPGDHIPASTSLVPATKRTRATVKAAVESVGEPSPPPKKKRTSSKYAGPAKYAHLSPLVDILEPNLICVFVGTNPGVQTAVAGHAYAHPSNHFWKLLHSSGLTDRRLKPEEDRSLPGQYCMGNTNIVERPSKDAAELSKEEMAAGTANLEAKFRKFKPEAVCMWARAYGKPYGVIAMARTPARRISSMDGRMRSITWARVRKTAERSWMRTARSGKGLGCS